jgi:hypothetical protein
MKPTYTIELQRVKAMVQSPGAVEARIDALVLPKTGRGGESSGSTLSLSVENARVLVLLLKAQIAEAEGRKPRSPR